MLPRHSASPARAFHTLPRVEHMFPSIDMSRVKIIGKVSEFKDSGHCQEVEQIARSRRTKIPGRGEDAGGPRCVLR